MMQDFKPAKEHKWLQKLVGEWTYQHDIPAMEGTPATTVKGTETFRAIGEIWVQGEGRGPMPDGSDSTSLMTLGYDPEKKRFVGTWLGTMAPLLWIYDGELDASERALSLHSNGPNMDGTAGTQPYMDVVEFISDDHRTLTGHTKDADGVWQPFMTVHYRRKSK